MDPDAFRRFAKAARCFLVNGAEIGRFPVDLEEWRRILLCLTQIRQIRRAAMYSAGSRANTTPLSIFLINFAELHGNRLEINEFH